MKYPIFNSFTNQIKNELNKKDINIKTFRTWNEDRINATGLEILIDACGPDSFVKEVSINFDWDRFRETVLATQLEGLEEHPMLQKNSLKSITVSPKMDVEISWIFDEQQSEIMLPGHSQTNRLEHAGQWMEEISKEVNDLLTEDDIITRWHLEVEGNRTGKRLTSVSLLSYFQYSLSDLKSLNDVHLFINKKLRDLLVKSKKVRQLSNSIIKHAA